MRRKILYVITILAFPLMLFNFIAALCVPFLKCFNVVFIRYLIRIEVSIWLAVFLSSTFLQRAHCSHSCAISGVFEIISNVTRSKDIMNMKYPKVLKYIVTTLWFLGSGFVFFNVLGKQLKWFDVSPVFDDPFVILYYSFFFISAVLSISFGKSNVEHYVCPFSPWIMTGIKLGRKMRIPSLTIVTDSSKCVKCRQCNRACIMNQDVCQKVTDQKFKQQECMNCFECVKACKTGALKRKWLRN